MNILHLKYFVDIAQMGSVSRAAQENHIAQPAMSRILKSIEEEYGAELFERKGRNIYLNPCGEIFYEAAKKCLSILKSAEESINIYSGKLKGKVRIGLHTPSMQIPEICHAFNKEYPDIFLDIQKPPFTSTDIYYQNYDLLILMGPLPSHSGYESVLLGTNRIKAVVSKDHPFAQRESIRVKDLAGYPLTVPILPGFRQIVTSFCMGKNFIPEIIGVCENRTEHQILINSEPEKRIGIMLDSYAQTWKGEYKVLPFEDEDFIVKIYMTWNNEVPLRISVEVFKDFFIENYKNDPV